MSHAYICSGIRTPIGRFGGSLSTVRPDDLAAHVIRELMFKNKQIDPEKIDDVILGCANQAGEDNRNVSRMAILLSGLPSTISGNTVNRLCGSGLDAILIASRSIIAGQSDIIIAGGVESMTRAPFVMPKSQAAFSRVSKIEDTTIGWRFINPKLQSIYGTDSMPETAENVAEEFNISRVDQDKYALSSQKKAIIAQNNGRLGIEITSVKIPQRKGEDIIFAKDEHPRETSLEKLSSLSTPFKKDGSITAGNASGVNDGAAALIIASEKAIKEFSLNPLARISGGAAAGVEPRIMGIGPVSATNKLLKRLNMNINDIDLIELNEAFAAQSLACLRLLGIEDDSDKVNPNGGSIALGHPLGMSGARIALSAAIEISEKSYNNALCTMCVGVGQGISMIIEKP